MKQTFTLLGFLLLSITFCFGQSTLKESNGKKSFHELLQASNSHFKALNTLAISKTSSNLKTASSYTYSLDGYTDYYWDGSSWNEDLTYEFSYNSNDLLSQAILYEGWSDDKYLSTYTYDDNGNISAYLEFSWNETAGNWYTDAYYRELYTYDDDGNLTQSIASQGESGTWSPQYKIETTYNDYGYDTSSEYEYKTNTSSWDKLIVYARTYDSNGYLTMLTVSSRDDVNSDWSIMYGPMIVDSNNHVLSYSAYDGDPNDSNSSIGEKGVFTYVNGNVSTNIYQTQDDSGNWYDYEKQEYIYDTNYSISEILMPAISNKCFKQERETNSEFNNKLTEYLSYDYDEESGELIATDKRIFNYTDLTTATGIDNDEEVNVILYPNPAYDNVSISFSSTNNLANIQLFDMLGKKVLDKEISSEETINIENLNSGIYLYNIVVDGKSQSGKLFKK